MNGDFPPRVDEYFNVECNDISRGGVSFFLKRPPGCEKFAIVLGQKPMITIMVAKVVNIKEVTHNDQHQYLVGCKFISQIKSD
jgi:hypothetical protein